MMKAQTKALFVASDVSAERDNNICCNAYGGTKPNKLGLMKVGLNKL